MTILLRTNGMKESTLFFFLTQMKCSRVEQVTRSFPSNYNRMLILCLLMIIIRSRMCLEACFSLGKRVNWKGGDQHICSTVVNLRSEKVCCPVTVLVP